MSSSRRDSTQRSAIDLVGLGRLGTFVGQGASVTSPATFTLPEPASAFRLSYDLDSSGSVLALFSLTTEATDLPLYWTRYTKASGAWSAPARFERVSASAAKVTFPSIGKPSVFAVDQSAGVDKARVVVTSFGSDDQWTEPEPISDAFVADAPRSSFPATRAA